MILIFIVGPYLLTIGFLCYAAVLPVWRELPWYAKVWLLPLFAFFPIDVFVRFTLGTIVFLEMPSLASLTVTALCNAHCHDTNSYRGSLSRAICRVLNMVQPNHCESLKQGG